MLLAQQLCSSFSSNDQGCGKWECTDAPREAWFLWWFYTCTLANPQRLRQNLPQWLISSFFVSTSFSERQHATALLSCRLAKLPLSSLGLLLKNLSILPIYESAVPSTNRIFYGKTQWQLLLPVPHEDFCINLISTLWTTHRLSHKAFSM